MSEQKTYSGLLSPETVLNVKGRIKDEQTKYELEEMKKLEEERKRAEEYNKMEEQMEKKINDLTYAFADTIPELKENGIFEYLDFPVEIFDGSEYGRMDYTKSYYRLKLTESGPRCFATNAAPLKETEYEAAEIMVEKYDFDVDKYRARLNAAISKAGINFKK